MQPRQKSGRGAAKVNTSNGPLWHHVSWLNATVKLRRFAEGNVFEEKGDWNNVEDIVSLEECQKLLPGQRDYKNTNAPVWTKILGKLQEGAVEIEAESQRKAVSKCVVVPVTPLRRFYYCMPAFDQALFEGLAKFYESNPQALVNLWNRSRTAFEPYCNPEGWGQGKRLPLPEDPGCLKGKLDTDKFTAYVTNRMYANNYLGFTFVQREINPWSTKNGIFRDKKRASKTGRGGIDLLLACNSEPVICEVKVADDKNAFYALLQAMTYAVELSTPNQLMRLKTHFSASFPKLDTTYGKVNIAIVFVNPVKDATRDPVERLITHLNTNCKCRGLGKIELLWNEDEKWHRHS